MMRTVGLQTCALYCLFRCPEESMLNEKDPRREPDIDAHNCQEIKLKPNTKYSQNNKMLKLILSVYSVNNDFVHNVFVSTTYIIFLSNLSSNIFIYWSSVYVPVHLCICLICHYSSSLCHSSIYHLPIYPLIKIISFLNFSILPRKWQVQDWRNFFRFQKKN